MKEPKFPIGSKVKFKDSVYTSTYYSNYLKYKGHEFLVHGYMADDGIEVDFVTGKLSVTFSPEVVTDHLMLCCYTDYELRVDGYIHDFDVELI